MKVLTNARDIAGQMIEFKALGIGFPLDNTFPYFSPTQGDARIAKKGTQGQQVMGEGMLGTPTMWERLALAFACNLVCTILFAFDTHHMMWADRPL